MDEIAAFYDGLADDYPALFADWDASVGRQAEVIDALIQARVPHAARTVLDATCGIGTQAIGLAKLGYHVTASDLSSLAVARARREALRLGATLAFAVADVRDLPEAFDQRFDVVISFDNALAHLVEPPDLDAALRSVHRVLRSGGLFLASIRDYDRLLVTRPAGEPPRLSGTAGSRRMVVQAWDWMPDEPRYRLHQFVLNEQSDGGWSARHLEASYRALLRTELEETVKEVGFLGTAWLEPIDTRFYQPILCAFA